MATTNSTTEPPMLMREAGRGRDRIAVFDTLPVLLARSAGRRAPANEEGIGARQKKHVERVTTTRLILAQGPCLSSLNRSNF